MQNQQLSKPKSRKMGICQGIILTQFVGFMMLLGVEVAGRKAGYDFDHQAAAFYQVPVFLRKATVPVGEAFFRRPGPVQWRGRALSLAEKHLGISGASRTPSEDPEILLEYDEQGFRNAQGLHDWEVVVVGDSFTELGSVTSEDLFTSRLGKMLGLRVKNLGVSDTGTLTQTVYLEKYGVSASTKDAMIVFFEGNDIDDLIRENERLLHARTGNKENRSLEALPRQSSFIKAVCKLLEPSRPMTISDNAIFEVDGHSKPVRIRYAPLGSARLPAGIKAMLRESLQCWAAAAKRLNVKPWLVFMPCKHRVLHRHLKYMDHAPRWITEWAPTDFPDIVQAMCREAGIEFIDLSPRLIAEAARGRLTFNATDSHLNREGSLCVAEELADALRHELETRPTK
jgi:hypothetical protein